MSTVIFSVSVMFMPAGEVDEDDLSRLTAKELRQHFERTIEEATPRKQIKVYNIDLSFHSLFVFTFSTYSGRCAASDKV